MIIWLYVRHAGYLILCKNLLHCSIRLTKNIPIGAGLGGGSADAAAIIKGLLQFWGVTIDHDKLFPFLESLGADVPVCYEGKSCFVEGIGEIVSSVSDEFPRMHALLIYPNKFCATPEVFRGFDGPFIEEMKLPNAFQDQDALFEHLKATQNSLTGSAQNLVPDIKNVLSCFGRTKRLPMARMSGSGSACFGLFKNSDMCRQAEEDIKNTYPEWWLRSVVSL